MKTITICSSIKYMETIKATIERLELLGIAGLFPNIDFQAKGKELSIDEMKKLQKDHFEAIKSSDAIYVINLNGYVGKMVSTEIGYAVGLNKEVFFSEETGSIEFDALSSGVILLSDVQEFEIK